MLLRKSPNTDDSNNFDRQINQDYDVDALLNQRKKRPARLFPAHILNGYFSCLK